MSETNAPEPTMEEILASIRRIISEDDGGASAAPPAVHEPEPHPEDQVLELTQKVEPHPVADESVGDLDVFVRSPPPPESVYVAPPPPAPEPPRPAPPRPALPPAQDEGLVSMHAAETAAAHFGQLAQSIAMPAPGVTLDDVVRELLKPLLRDWLDQHLGGIVEAKVQAEVERIARQRR